MNIRNRLTGQFNKLFGVKSTTDLTHVDEMMGHASAFLGSRFRGADVHAAIHLHGVSRHDLGFQLLRQFKCDSALTDSGWAHEKGGLHCIHIIICSVIYKTLSTDASAW